MKRGLVNATAARKVLVPKQILTKQKAWFVKPIMTVPSLHTNENVISTHVKQSLKNHFRNQNKSFNYIKYKNETELLKYFGENKPNGAPKITWEINKICCSYISDSKRCFFILI